MSTSGEPLPELETGWLPTTPAGDTYLRRFLLNWAGMCAVIARSYGGHSEERPAAYLADSGRPAAFSNCATLMQPLAVHDTSSVLDEIADFFAFADPTRRGEVLLASAWPTGDLRPFGWNLMGHPPLHLLPTGANPRPTPPDLRIERVRDLTGIDAWERATIEGIPLEGLAGVPPGALVTERWLQDPRSRLWVGWVGQRPVSASAAWIEHGINNVTLVATIPDARRRGYGEALTWRAALADPAVPAMLFSSDDGRPVYERMGFLPLQRLTLWYRSRPAWPLIRNVGEHCHRPGTPARVPLSRRSRERGLGVRADPATRDLPDPPEVPEVRPCIPSYRTKP